MQKHVCGMKKRTAVDSPFRFFSLSALDLVALQASRADVIAHDFAFFDEGDLLDVRLEGSSRFAMAVADVVSRRLTLSANTANSRHIDTSAGINSTFGCAEFTLRKTSKDIISFP